MTTIKNAALGADRAASKVIQRSNHSAIEATLPHEVELAIRRLAYREVDTICASDVAAETPRKLERRTPLDDDTREYLRDGARSLANDSLRRRWGIGS